MKKKTICILWIIIGIILFILPVLSYPFAKGYLDETNYENRYFAEKPIFTVENYRVYAVRYEEYFNDHLPYRNQLVRGMNLLKYRVFQENVGQVINGKDGWLFYAGADAVNCYKRSSSYGEDFMRSVVDHLSAVEKELSGQGVQFAVLLLPNKEEIYDEYMPDYYIRPETPGRTDKLVDYIRRNTDVKLVYPKEEMRSERDRCQLYFKYDTHYNCLGALVAYEQVLNSMGKERKYLSDYEICQANMSGRPSGKGDLKNMMGFPGNSDDDYEYYVTEYPLLEEWEQQEYMSGNPLYEEKILLVGDSFRISLLPYFAKDFSGVKVVDVSARSQGEVHEYQPDWVVFVLLERDAEYMSYYDF